MTATTRRLALAALIAAIAFGGGSRPVVARTANTSTIALRS